MASAVYSSVALWVKGIAVFAQTSGIKPAWPLWLTNPALAHHLLLSFLIVIFFLALSPYLCSCQSICVAMSWFLSAVNHCFAYLWVNDTSGQGSCNLAFPPPWLAQYECWSGAIGTFKYFLGMTVFEAYEVVSCSKSWIVTCP